MGKGTWRIESPENMTTNSYFEVSFWVQKWGIPFISIHLWYRLTCITYNHPSVAMVHYQTRNSEQAHCLYTDNNKEHRWPLLLFLLPLCVLVHLVGSAKYLCYSTHVILTTTKAVGAAITRLSTRSFKNFYLPVTKTYKLLHQRQKVPSRILKWKK